MFAKRMQITIILTNVVLISALTHFRLQIIFVRIIYATFQCCAKLI